MFKQQSIIEKVENGIYNMKEKIGEGAYGEVFLANSMKTSSTSAMKVIKITTSFQRTAFDREMKFANENKFSSQFNILKYKNVYKINHWSGSYGVLVMEPMERDLLDFVIKHKRISEIQSKKIFYEICKAIGYLHSQKNYHLDLKPENILIKMNRNNKEEIKSIRLCDFGFFSNQMIQMNSNFGTMEYMPLECVCKERNYPILSEKVDIWSLGVILFVLITGMFPFIYKDGILIRNNLEKIREFCADDQCYLLLNSIFVDDPFARPSVEEILKFDWLKGVDVKQNFLEKISEGTSLSSSSSLSKSFLKLIKKKCKKTIF